MTFVRMACVSLMVLGSLQAEGSEKRNIFRLGVVSTQGDARDMTQKATGYQLELGRSFASRDMDLSFRVYGGLVKVGGDRDFQPYVLVASGSDGLSTIKLPLSQYDPAKHGNILKIQRSYNLRGNYVGLDLEYRLLTTLPIRVFTGPVITQYYIERLQPFETAVGNNSPKIGWRVGVAYDLSADWQATLVATQTEYQSKNSNEKVPVDPLKPTGTQVQKNPYEPGFNPSRPWYLSFTVGYRF